MQREKPKIILNLESCYKGLIIFFIMFFSFGLKSIFQSHYMMHPVLFYADTYVYIRFCAVCNIELNHIMIVLDIAFSMNRAEINFEIYENLICFLFVIWLGFFM
jgi:hypothetical protein